MKNSDYTMEGFYDKCFDEHLKNYSHKYTNKIEKPIDKCTTNRLDIVLKMCGHNFDIKLVDNIIDMVELIEDKGGDVTIDDVIKLKQLWK